eukprot:Skav227516  [mRNA]  locus=scaffold2269:49857:50541:- [translate_table: standard]
MFLQPWDFAPAKVGFESWRTSWETSKLGPQGPTVFASNDITLAEEPKPEETTESVVSSFDTADFPQPFLML